MSRLLFLLFIVQFGIAACSSQGQTQPITRNTNLRIHYDIMYTPVIINSTDTIELLFDTGCLVGCLLPQSLARNYADTMVNNGWLQSASKIKVNSIELGTQSLNSNIINSVPVDMEGLIAPIYAEEKRIWCFDFDNQIFSIRDCDTLPKGALVYPLQFAKYKDKKLAPFVNLPMTIKNGCDSLQTDYIYLFDTGTPSGFAITDPPKELSDFVSAIPHWQIEDSYCLQLPDRELREFEVDINLASNILPNTECVFDTSLRSVSKEFKAYLPNITKPIVGTLGMRILKHFNIILDFKNNRLILTPAQHIYPSKPSNQTGFWCNQKGVIIRIRKNDKAYQQGIRLGDTVLTVNGVQWINISDKETESLYSAPERSIWEINSKVGKRKITYNRVLKIQ
ncbi:MAG: hypothetical protein RR971_03415 [Alistipes sp.]